MRQTTSISNVARGSLQLPQRMSSLVLLWCLMQYQRSLVSPAQAAILPLTLVHAPEAAKPLATQANRFGFGYIEYQPNGTLILRSTMENGNNLQNLMLLRTILNAIKVATFAQAHELPAAKVDFKIYGEGVEHRFPPFLENIIQRIQTYFSVYKYTDTSRPVRHDGLSTEAEMVPAVIDATTTTEPLESDTALETTTFVDIADDSHETDEHTEFISIGENDGFLTVGED